MTRNIFICLLFSFCISCSLFSQIPPTPTITVPYGTATVCSISLGRPGLVTLVSSATSGNVWSNGATTQSVYISATGNYYVTQVVGNYTSSPSAAIDVSIHPMPSATLLPIGPFCTNSPPIVLQGLPIGPPGSYSNYSGQGVTGNTFTPANANIGSNNFIGFLYSQLFGNDLCSDSSFIRVTVLDCATGMEEQKEKKCDIIIYAKENSGCFLIQSSTEKIHEVMISDLGGTEILSKHNLYENDVQADISNKPPGIYTVIISLDSLKVTKRIAKLE